jgi:FemAB-related protein (PEP-CTERM system-associated)
LDSIESLNEDNREEWDAYVEAQPNATCYHLRAWGEAAERAYGMRTSFLLARRGGLIVGVQPLFIVRRPLQCYVTSGIFGSYGTILADDAKARASLIEGARAVVDREGASCLQLKMLGNDVAFGDDFTPIDAFVTATMRLAPDHDQLWHAFDGDMRTRIRKGQKAGFVVDVGPEQLDAFYDVLSENMHRKGSPIYGIAFLRALLEALGDSGEIITLSKDGRPVSGALVIYFNGVACVPFVSSRASTFKLRPANFLYWEIIRRACARGMNVLDFGRSPSSSSNLQFKRSWGATLTPVPFYVYDRRVRRPTLDSEQSGPQYLSAVWKRLPRIVVDAFGPTVSRWIA